MITFGIQRKKKHTKHKITIEKGVEAMKHSESMTEGNIVKSILWFAFPIMIGNIFQQLYNVVDTAIIGNVLGKSAIAAVGASTPIYNLIIGFACGITNGFSVVLARFYGAKDEAQMKKTVTLTYLLTILISLVLTVGILLTLTPFLKVLKTPDKIIGQTAQYLKIIMACSLITMLFNMFSGILRAIGNSKMPLYFLIVASAVNIVLDIVFVKYCGMGFAGAAYATVIAQLVSVVLCILYIYRKCRLLVFDKAYLHWDGALIKELILMGLSMGLMLVVVSIGSVALQRGINSLGEDLIASHTAGRKIDDMFMLPLGTVSTAASTFASQNLGAGKIKRVQKGIQTSIKIALVWSLLSTIISLVFGKPMIAALTGTKEAFIINAGYRFIKWNIPFYFILSFLLVLRSSLQGLGRKIVPIMGSMIELIMKFATVGIITNQLGYFGVCILEPIIWGMSAVLVIADYMRFIREHKEEGEKA